MTDSTDNGARFRVDASSFAKALALLASVTERRNTVPILANVLIEARGERLCLTATDLDSRLTIALHCETEAPGLFTLPIVALADAAKAAAKEKGARIELSAGTDTAELISGRARMRFPVTPADDFPALEDGDAAESWEASGVDVESIDCKADGLDVTPKARKLLKKLAKRAGDAAVTVARHEPDAKTWRLRVFGGGADFDFSTPIAEARLFATPAARDPYTFGHDVDAEREALSYLRTLRRAHDLPDVDGVRGLVEADASGRLIVHNGRAVGLTIGGTMPNYAQSVEMPDGWTPPADCLWGEHSATIDGVEYWNARANGPGCPDAWLMRYKPDAAFTGYRAPAAYVAGAYSLPMPIDQRRAIAALTVDVDGEAIPLRHKVNGHGAPMEIELDADAVAALCGPVDPSTFVDIEALAFHHGRLIARGPAALRFEAMREAFDKNARKALKNCRSTPDKFLTSHNLGLSWRDRVAEFLTTLEAVEEHARASIEEETAAPIETALGTFQPAGKGCHVLVIEPTYTPAPIDNTADPFDGFTDPADFVDAPAVELEAPETLAAIDAYLAPDVAADDADAWQAVKAAIDAPETIEAPAVDVAADPEPAAMPASALERRLARIESALGLVDRSKRTPAHAAAIRRAWSIRCEYRAKMAAMRAAREDDARRWQETECARLAVIRERAALADRVDRAESFANGERAELVSEIDRLRAQRDDNRADFIAKAHRLQENQIARRRLARRAAAMRLDLHRTRAERDGIAGNLAAMTARVAADAATLDRLQPIGDRPRFILNAR